MYIKKAKYAMLRLNKNNEALFSEHQRAKKDGLEKDALLKMIKKILSKNKEKSLYIQTHAVLDGLLL